MAWPIARQSVTSRSTETTLWSSPKRRSIRGLLSTWIPRPRPLEHAHRAATFAQTFRRRIGQVRNADVRRAGAAIECNLLRGAVRLCVLRGENLPRWPCCSPHLDALRKVEDLASIESHL